MCKRLIYVMTFVLALGGTANAALYLWNGSAADGLWDTPANWAVTDSLWTWPNEENAADPNLAKNINSDTIAIDILNGDAVNRGSPLAIQGAADGSTTAVLTLNNGSSLTVNGRLAIGGVDGTRGQIDILSGSTVTIIGDGNDLRLADNDNTWTAVNIVDSTVNIADDLNTDQGEGYINISGSSIINADDIIAGDGATSVGYVDISGTATINVDDLKTDDGEGHITIGGNATLNLDDIIVPDKPTGVGTLDISGTTTVTIADDLDMDEGTGNITIGGDTVVSNGDDLYIGDKDGSVCTLTLTDNMVFNVGDDINIADDTGSEGHMIVTGNATLNAPDELYIADANNALGTLDISGTATVTIGDDLNIGSDGPGTCNIGENATVTTADKIYISENTAPEVALAFESHMSISGNATVEVATDFIVVDNAGNKGYLHISGNPTITTNRFYMNDDDGDPSYSQVIMDGGTVTVNDYCTFNDDNPGTAEFIMNGGSFYCGNYLNVSDNLNGTAHLTMNGGEMITGNRLRLGKDDGEDTGQVRIFMNGGLLQAEGLDIKITDTKIVFSGGEIWIRQPFQPDPVGDPENWWGLSEADMQNLIDIGTIEVTGDYNILTDGAYTVLSAPSAPPAPEPPAPEPAPPAPVVVQIESRVAASSDDAEEWPLVEGGKMDSVTSSDLELGYEKGETLQTVGIRLLDIQIPQGATITSAWVQFSADDVDNDWHVPGVSLVIEGEMSPNPVTFSENTADITSRLVTTASVVWDIPQWMEKHLMGPDEQTPDISAIIQEIVNQPDWAAGNAIVLMFRDNPDNPSAGTREAEAFDGEPAEAPLLHIEYAIEEAPAPPEPEPTPPEPEPAPPEPEPAPPAPEDIWFEAEAGDPLGANWRIYDDETASGGKCIGSNNGDGDDFDAAPGAKWVATYNFTAAGGDYKVVLRTISPNLLDNSFWVRIPTATSQNYEDPDQAGTGWVNFNDIDQLPNWQWDEVHSHDDKDKVVNWTLPAGDHTLEIAKREDGVMLDAILITSNLDLDQATLPDATP